MPCPGVGPCEVWDLDLCCLISGALPDPCLVDGGQVVPQAVVDSAVLAASQFLWAATGRQFGCCQVTIRPTQDPMPCGPGEFDSYKATDFGFPWVPMHLPDGTWTNVSCLCGKDPCGCPADPCSIRLPYPVCSVDQVKVDGQIIGKSLYRVDNFEKLVFTPGVVDIHEPTDAAAGPIGGPIVQGQISVTGPNVQALSGAIRFPDVGVPYTIDFPDNKQNIILEFEVPAGHIGSFVLGLAGGDFEIFMGDGHAFPPGPSHVGPLVSYTNPADQDSTYTFYVVSNDSGQADEVTLTRVSGPDGVPLNLGLKSVSWTEPGAGMNCFPKCNNLALTDDEVGTMSVTLTYGRPVPELVRLAAAEFACEIIKNCVGAPCTLPKRVQSITRQGVSVSFLDPMDFIEKGKTGIYLVDLAIKTYNPNMLMQRAAVYSPDVANKWRVTTWENKFGGREDPLGPNCT